jgi:hypothetical protein
MPTITVTASSGGRATDRSERPGRPATTGLLPLRTGGPAATSIQAHPQAPPTAGNPSDR